MLRNLFDDVPQLESERLIISRVRPEDCQGLREMIQDEKVYRYLPTFLYEKQDMDPLHIIQGMNDECIRKRIAIHLGIFLKPEKAFCGLAELYGYKREIHKVSIGYRLKSAYWGKGIASETVRMLVDYLYGMTDVEIITASTMPDNNASARVLRKNGFELVVSGSGEDWGFQEPTLADKWIR